MIPQDDHQPDIPYYRRHLFLIRVWHKPGSDGKPELHGRLQRIASGENRLFRGPAELVEMLEAFLPNQNQSHVQEPHSTGSQEEATDEA